MGPVAVTLFERMKGFVAGGTGDRLYGIPTQDVLLFELRQKPPEDEHWDVQSPLAIHTLDELVTAGFAVEQSDGFRISWADLYACIGDADRAATMAALAIPPIGSLRPRLRSANSLDDSDFEIAIDGWLGDKGRTEATKLGAVARTKNGLELLGPAAFELTQRIDEFWADPARGPERNRFHWGRIRSSALRAHAGLDRFLADTVVVTPEKLDIRLQEVDVAGSGVVEVQPWFAEAPESWLTHFDRAPRIRDRYQIATEEGLIEVQITPQVKSVLSAIKAMPGRRASGRAAERFLHNPFAALGPDAVAVLDEAQFDEARRQANIAFERFTARPVIKDDRVVEVYVVVESLSEDAGSVTHEQFNSPAELAAFIRGAESRLREGAQLFEWRRHRLELGGDSDSELDLLKSAYDDWIRPSVTIKAVDVMDLARYSQRVSGIGVQPKIVSPYIPANSESDPWFPESASGAQSSVAVAVPISDGRTLDLLVDPKVYATLRRAVSEAEAADSRFISVPGHPNSVPIEAAKAVVEALEPRFGEIPRKTSPPGARKAESGTRERKELLLRANIAQPEFTEERAKELELAPNAKPNLPRCLLNPNGLKQHQRDGIAWLQHLYRKAPEQCRGAVLADDMGLGKTLQLLTMICHALEENPDLEPVLIVAPVALIENWKEEAEKFFSADRPRMLVLHGSALNARRAPRESIDAELLGQGMARFLRVDWIGDARIVLTTYEALRDLEFSFAAVRWSIMVCDEAQKIKNPSTMVTRAAKKQNAAFRIACTGTPVENSLADLWCLFDFIQPGLLGALNEFGATYRRPIECKTEDQKARVEQLRALIDPQILRRTKQQVAKDLPPKIAVGEADPVPDADVGAWLQRVESPRTLSLSDYQRALYSNAIEQFRKREELDRTGSFKSHLSLLQYLRRLCVAPEPPGAGSVEPISLYRKKNPKLDWLIRTLHEIRARAEKAIIFCEFRDAQALLAYYIEQEFRFRPDVINGDTAAAATAADSRQKRIKRFQALSGFGAIILSPAAVGFGLNIQAANHVIHFSRTWNPAREDQATDRAYRIGQARPVFVYCPVVCAEDFTTFDVKLDYLISRKRALSEDMLNGCGDLMPDEFTDIV